MVGTKGEALDERWFPRLLAIYFEPYKLLVGDKTWRESEEVKFLSGEIENPTLDYSALKNFPFTERREQLMTLRADLLNNEANEAVVMLYRRKMSEVAAMLSLLAATLKGNDQAFTRYSDFVYGELESSDIQYVTSRFRQLVEGCLNQGGEVALAAERLSTLIVNLPLCPSLGVAVDCLPPSSIREESVDLGQVIEAFREALTAIAATDWQLVVGESGVHYLSVSQETKTVHLPSKEQLQKRQLKPSQLKGLIAHEVETHIKRRRQGDASRLRLLGLGLDHYLRAEEGIATWREQQHAGAEEFAGFVLYTLILAARGYIGSAKDFRRTHEFACDFLTLLHPANSKESTRWLAYKNCERIFRGTTARTPGAVFTKDSCYFGNRTIWNLVLTHPEWVPFFDVGKFDPLNDTHVTLLKQLEILPDYLP